MKSFLHVPSDNDFSIANIPFGVFSTATEGSQRRIGVAIGDYILDLTFLASQKVFSKEAKLHFKEASLESSTLNEFAALGREVTGKVRLFIQDILSEDTKFPEILKENPVRRAKALISREIATMHLPMTIGDYTDFYAGLNHATNVGVLFRGRDNALQPNYLHLPVGYHGRASSIVVSGTPVVRPRGQILANPTAKEPSFEACKKLDIELELAAFVALPNLQGEPVKIEDARDHIFGVVLMNDWSARDIQAWEYVPLGPFNAKNFATTISPWIITMDALEPLLEPRADPIKPLLPYLQEATPQSLSLNLEVYIKPAGNKEEKVFTTNSKHLYYSFQQMLAHHTATGCNMRTGDLLGSGTISGEDSNSVGSLLEATHNGKEPIAIAGRATTFLQDGDMVNLVGYGNTDNGRIGFGDCKGTILPSYNETSTR